MQVEEKVWAFINVVYFVFGDQTWHWCDLRQSLEGPRNWTERGERDDTPDCRGQRKQAKVRSTHRSIRLILDGALFAKAEGCCFKKRCSKCFRKVLCNQKSGCSIKSSLYLGTALEKACDFYKVQPLSEGKLKGKTSNCLGLRVTWGLQAACTKLRISAEVQSHLYLIEEASPMLS